MLANFVQNNARIKRLGSMAIVALADYFDVSIDEMIGRCSYDSKQSNDIPTHDNSLEAKDNKVERLIEQVIIQGLEKSREEGIQQVALNMLKENADKIYFQGNRSLS